MRNSIWLTISEGETCRGSRREISRSDIRVFKFPVDTNAVSKVLIELLGNIMGISDKCIVRTSDSRVVSRAFTTKNIINHIPGGFAMTKAIGYKMSKVGRF